MAFLFPALELLPEAGALAAEGLGSLFGGAEATTAATVSSEATLWGALPELTTTQKVVGATVALDAGKNLIQGKNIVSGVAKDATTLVSGVGVQAGKLAGETIQGAAEGFFSNLTTTELLLIAAAGYYALRR